MTKTTNLMGYTVKIKELFDNPKSSKPTRVQVSGENHENWLIKYYKIEGNFYEYMYEIIRKFKKDILDMEKTLDKN